ncbi:hypothetical protein BCR35DRAFT_335916 [Leucosporidium creatinivorum]|uniref:Coiled-coil domain-containing protein n=1 Tax=Leucosporidium creatinivorum TaxID=106004 RepID=A0A1Y2D490_9BASI|nr:hypothetical protein BCR35DRAFT_335916 [Leucosporidium creatinivorum]
MAARLYTASDDGKKHRTGGLLAWEEFSKTMTAQLKLEKPNQKGSMRQKEIRRLWKKDPTNPDRVDK